MTTRYPHRSDAYGDEFPGAVRVWQPEVDPGAGLAGVCPTDAIGRSPDGQITLDQGRCVLCGACVAMYPDVFFASRGSELARLDRHMLVVPESPVDDGVDVTAIRAELAKRVRALRRSVHIRHVDVGSDGTEEWEIHALSNPVYDVHRLGIFFTASPRHADVLMITGAGARGMLEPLRRTQEAMPNPVVVIAVGTDAISGGLTSPTYATTGGLVDEIDVDVYVPGSPPPPFAILHGLLLALGRLPAVRGVEGSAP